MTAEPHWLGDAMAVVDDRNPEGQSTPLTGECAQPRCMNPAGYGSTVCESCAAALNNIPGRT